MKIPGCEEAVVDIRKLTDYCLNESHRRGQHNARVFNAALGITQSEAEILRTKLLEIGCGDTAIETRNDEYGQRYHLDFEMTTDKGTATIRSGWIVRTDEDFPRLATCYVLEEVDDDETL